MRAADTPFLEALYLLQESALGSWITQSSWALFFFLIVHTLSMGLLAGTGLAVSLRVLGVARDAPLAMFARFLPLMAAALAAAAVSGVFLVIGYPAKALTNPVFYLKLGLIAAALLLTRRLARGVLRRPEPATSGARLFALLAILAWDSRSPAAGSWPTRRRSRC